MAKSLQRLKQIAKPDSFDDTKTPTEIVDSETASEHYGEFLEAVLSQIKRIIHGNLPGNWHDDPALLIGDFKYLSYKQDVACLFSDSIGDWLCVRGDRINGKWRVEKADPENIDKMPAIGVLISKSTPTVGVMQMIGPCNIFTGLDYSKPTAWLGSSGIQYTLPIPGAGNYIIAQKIGKAVASDIFWISGSLEHFRRVDY